MWELTLGGQTLCWTAVVCSVKLNRRMNKQTADNVGFMALYLLNQSQSHSNTYVLATTSTSQIAVFHSDLAI